MEQAALRSCGCPIPSSAQGQAGGSFEPPDLGESVPDNGRGFGIR